MGILIRWLLQEPADLDIHCLQEKPADQDLHCLQEKPADQDPYCLQELISDFYTVFKRVNCLSTERYKANLFFRSSKDFYGQVHCGHLLVPGQVEKFTISTPLNKI